ncbi:MAG: hypothetical protein HC817_08765 [Saprospiraceae bacterium]|nr:hypothetical protein [Saprospiraceae bacterium]
MANELKTNNFHQLMEDEFESRFTLPQMMAVEQLLQKKQNSLRVTGDVVDLFFPKIIKTFVALLGGDMDSNDKKANTPDVGGGLKSNEPRAPGQK